MELSLQESSLGLGRKRGWAQIYLLDYGQAFGFCWTGGDEVTLLPTVHAEMTRVLLLVLLWSERGTTHLMGFGSTA